MVIVMIAMVSFASTAQASNGDEAIWYGGQTMIVDSAALRRNLCDRTPKRHLDALHEGLDLIFKADDKDAARQAFNNLAAELEGKTDKAIGCWSWA